MPAMTYDDTNLRRLFAELAPAKRYKALRRGFLRQAKKVRGAVIKNILASGVNHASELARGARSVVYSKKKTGFRVTVGESRRGKHGKGFYYSKQLDRNIPLLRWMDTGTKPRSTKGRGIFMRGRRFTGSLPRYGFIEKARAEVGSSVERELKDEIVKSVKEVSKKYGCKV